MKRSDSEVSPIATIPNRPPQPTAYPSPLFLCTPAKEGRPSPEDLKIYWAYLLYQLRRGTAPKASMQAAAIKNGEHLRLAMNEVQHRCMQVLATGPAKSPDIAAKTGIALKDVQRQMANLRKREFVAKKRPAPGTGVHSTWSLTKEGCKALKTKGETTNA